MKNKYGNELPCKECGFDLANYYESDITNRSVVCPKCFFEMVIEKVFFVDQDCHSAEIDQYVVWKTSDKLVDFLEPIARYKINNSGDLGMTNRKDIGKIVRLLKISKSGLFIVVDDDNKIMQLPKRNLNLVDKKVINTTFKKIRI
jgi:hypothetical protein